MRDIKGKAVLAASIFLVLALGLAVWVTPVQAITGGQEDEDNIYSNVGAVLFQSDGQLYGLCSGTLIYEGGGDNGAVFLTAGHCTSYLEYLIERELITVDDVYVSFDQQLDLTGVLINLLSVSEVITHPDYKYNYQRSNTNDVGLLILENPVMGITPADLAPEGFLDQLKREGELRRGTKFTVVGYGGTLDWPPPEITYPFARFFTEESEFQALLKEWLLLSQNLALGNGGSCYGDSGGPVFWEEDDDRILVAIVGWGDTPCVETGFNYRVDIPDTLDFIHEHLPPE